MDISIMENGKFKLEMSKHVEEAIEAFGEKLKGESSSPEAKNRHTVWELSIELDEEKSKIYTQ